MSKIQGTNNKNVSNFYINKMLVVLYLHFAVLFLYHTNRLSMGQAAGLLECVYACGGMRGCVWKKMGAWVLL